jgi:hypothetical protein
MPTTEIGQVVASEGDFVAVSLWMPAAIATVFQPKAVALLEALTGAAAADGEYAPPFDSSHGPKNAWDLPYWVEPADRPAARWILGDVNAKQRRLVAMLTANPAGAWTKDLGAACGFDGRMSGTFKAIGGRFRRCDRRPMWNGGEKGAQGQRLTVKDPGALSVFTAVLLEDYPELAAEVGLS